MDFRIVDVFVREGCSPSGNPLAVVRAPLESLGPARMQTIAFEFGFSETVFVAPQPAADGSWPARIFTPAVEMPFAGHPTLGAAWVVLRELPIGTRAPGDAVTLQLPVGPVSVTASSADRPLWLTAPPVQFSAWPSPASVAAAWGLDPESLDPDFAPATLDAGPTPTLVPLRSLEALRALRDVRGGDGSLYVLARSRERPDRVHVRLFAPGHGVDEDPATGSAACCLAHYALATNYVGQGRSLRVEVLQGDEMGRPSSLHIDAERGPTPAKAAERIRVGGSVSPFAEGRLAGR